MQLNTLFSMFRRERLGLSMIIAALAVITVVVLLLFVNQQQSEEAHIREQGISLTRLLSRMPFDEVVPAAGKQGVFAMLKHAQSNAALAYVAVVDPGGKLIAELPAANVIVPPTPVSDQPTAWLGERTVSLSGDARQVTEFYAPLFNAGKIAGHVRLGYFKSDFGLHASQVPFIATLALPIFLMAALFYLLIKREIRPLHKINSQLDELVGHGTLGSVEIAATGELKDFMARFNTFIETAQQRVQQLESERNGFETRAKLLTYKRSRIESVLQSFPDALMVQDESGVPSMTNDRFGSLMGVKPEAAVGKKPAEWCDNQEVVAWLNSHTGNTRRSYNAPALEFHPATAPDKTFSASAHPLFLPNDESRMLGTLVMFRDVTAENFARSRNGDFLAHVSHELKTPLNVIAMYGESLMGVDGKDEDFRVEAVNVINDEVERLALLIDNMLNITRIETGSISIERKRVKLHDLLRDAFESCSRGSRNKQVKFDLDIPREISAVALDKNLLRIAINNLLTNAIKYSHDNGTVRLSAEETDMTVLISVSDDGLGITPEEQEKIFDKFYRSEDEEVRKRTGHGLGLSLAREIVQLHHGTLTVNSTPGKGSEFVIELDKEAHLLKQAV